ncbi:MAG: glycosyltransferase [Chitinophagaceae bacterium]
MQILFYISLILLAGYAALITYYWMGWLDIPEENLTGARVVSTKVTIIIPARNEEKNIANCLNALIAQTYPPSHFQVIVINDHSTDGTEEIIRKMALPNVLLINLRDHLQEKFTNSYKKRAIELGIRQATGELILCTDADCVARPGWVESMVNHQHKTGAVFIAAPVSISGDDSLLGIFQTLDFLPLQGITAAAVHRKVHSMSNGANLAYTREAFEKVNGFEGIDEIASGDDMLLMHKMGVAFPGRLSYLKSKEAIITTRPEPTIKAFMHQRIRWASKAGKYRDKSINAALLLVYLVNVAVGVFMIASLFSPVWLWNLLLLFVIKIFIEFFFVQSIARFYRLGRLMIFFPFIEPLHVLYTIFAGWLGVFGTYQWKNRKVR